MCSRKTKIKMKITQQHQNHGIIAKGFPGPTVRCFRSSFCDTRFVCKVKNAPKYRENTIPHIVKSFHEICFVAGFFWGIGRLMHCTCTMYIPLHRPKSLRNATCSRICDRAVVPWRNAHACMCKMRSRCCVGSMAEASNIFYNKKSPRTFYMEGFTTATNPCIEKFLHNKLFALKLLDTKIFLHPQKCTNLVNRLRDNAAMKEMRLTSQAFIRQPIHITMACCKPCCWCDNFL